MEGKILLKEWVELTKLIKSSEKTESLECLYNGKVGQRKLVLSMGYRGYTRKGEHWITEITTSTREELRDFWETVLGGDCTLEETRKKRAIIDTRDRMNSLIKRMAMLKMEAK